MRCQAQPSRTLFLLLACLLISAPALRAQAQKRPPKRVAHHDKQDIANLEDQWKTATLASDAVLMDRLLSDDYVGISWTGQVNTKAQQLDRVRTRSLNITHLEVSDLKIKVVQTVAIVTATSNVEGTNDGVPLHGDFRYTRIYQRLPSGIWKITNSEATRVPPPRRERGEHGPPPPPPSAAPTPAAAPPPK